MRIIITWVVTLFMSMALAEGWVVEFPLPGLQQLRNRVVIMVMGFWVRCSLNN